MIEIIYDYLKTTVGLKYEVYYRLPTDFPSAPITSLFIFDPEIYVINNYIPGQSVYKVAVIRCRGSIVSIEKTNKSTYCGTNHSSAEVDLTDPNSMQKIEETVFEFIC